MCSSDLQGKPKYYAMFGGATGNTDTTSGRIFLAPTPNTNYLARIHFNKMAGLLGVSHDTTSKPLLHIYTKLFNKAYISLERIQAFHDAYGTRPLNTIFSELNQAFSEFNNPSPEFWYDLAENPTLGMRIKRLASSTFNYAVCNLPGLVYRTASVATALFMVYNG